MTSTELTDTLLLLKKSSIELLQKMLVIMNEDVLEDSNMVEEIVEQCGNEIDQKQVVAWLESKTLFMISDAEKVYKQIDAFSKVVTTDPDKINDSSSDYPYLTEVWSGDIYDVDGIVGLQRLSKDIEKTIPKATEDYLIKSARKYFKK